MANRSRGTRSSEDLKWTTIAVLLVLVAASTTLFAVARWRQAQPVSATPAATTALGGRLFVDENSQAHAWVRAHPDAREARAIHERIANQPTAKWLGAWSGDVTAAVSEYASAAAAKNEIPVFVAYNLPNRDCGGQSSGGVADEQQYNTWIHALDAGLGDRRALVVLEPDALAQLDGCLSATEKHARLRMLSHAVDVLESDKVWVYLDAGHSNWLPAEHMTQHLQAAGIAKAHGFSLNVSNYNPTAAEESFGRQIDAALGSSKPFVVDTSRNGNGSASGEWCNPAGRKIGPAPQKDSVAEMLLWLKSPGESDGDCGVAPGTSAGEFSPDLANHLITGR